MGGGGAWEGLLGGGGEDRARAPAGLLGRGGGAEGSYRDRGGLLQDRGSYRKNILGNSFRGLYRKIL